MQLSGVERFFEKLGLSFLFSLERKVESISLSDIEPIALKGNFDLGFALGEYSRWETYSRKRTKLGVLVHKFKYEQDRSSGLILSDVASDFIESQMILKSADLILTVPPSFKSRSFDPVSFLVERLETRTKIRWEKDAFIRVRLTKPQKSVVGRESKQLNVNSTYKLATPIELKGKKILLIDDVIASGVTVDEISSILRQADAEKIYVLVLAQSMCPGMGDLFNQRG